MKYAITVQDKMMPRVDPVNPCPCQFEPVKLYYKKVKVFWQVKQGAKVEKDQLICEGEIEKKTLEFFSPCAGILTEILIEEGGKAGVGEILGYIEE